MDFLNNNFEITCNNYDYVSSIGDDLKLTYKVNNEPDYIVHYNSEFKIIKITSDNLCWENDELKRNEEYGILQKFKNFDPRYIYYNFQRISDLEYRQNLKTPFPGFTSHQIFIFSEDEKSYIKKSFLNSRELTEQQLEFNITLI